MISGIITIGIIFNKHYRVMTREIIQHFINIFPDSKLISAGKFIIQILKIGAVCSVY